MIGSLLDFFQMVFHDLAVVLQMMQLQFRSAGFKRIEFLQDFHAQVEEFLLAFRFCISCHFDLDQFFLCFLFGIKDAIQFRTLITNPLFIDQGAAVVEDFDHPVPAHVQIIFHHGLGLVQDHSDFRDLKSIDFLEQQCQMLFERKRFGNTSEAKSDVFLDLELALRRCFPDLQGFLKELAVVQGFLSTNIGYGFGPSFL